MRRGGSRRDTVEKGEEEKSVMNLLNLLTYYILIGIAKS